MSTIFQDLKHQIMNSINKDCQSVNNKHNSPPKLLQALLDCSVLGKNANGFKKGFSKTIESVDAFVEEHPKVR